MKFVALLSGGKDSCYTIQKALLSYGHELVCLANLSPPSDFEGEEMDSFMYQTAAYSALDSMALCFGVPLIRRGITGSALNQQLEYDVAQYSSAYPTQSSDAGAVVGCAGGKIDEVEDLYYLLLDVKQRFPNLEAVSCGAILSNYQRLRVESVCARPEVNLTVLAYLWQRERVGLLEEMIGPPLLLRHASGEDGVRWGRSPSSLQGHAMCSGQRRGQGQGQGHEQKQSIVGGLDAVLVKVAGAGLDPHRHLGCSLRALHPALLGMHERFGLDVCGEGGEYETLVLTCPAFSVEEGTREYGVNSKSKSSSGNSCSVGTIDERSSGNSEPEGGVVAGAVETVAGRDGRSLRRRVLVLEDTEVVEDIENYTVGNLKVNKCSASWIADDVPLQACPECRGETGNVEREGEGEGVSCERWLAATEHLPGLNALSRAERRRCRAIVQRVATASMPRSGTETSAGTGESEGMSGVCPDHTGWTHMEGAPTEPIQQESRAEVTKIYADAFTDGELSIGRDGFGCTKLFLPQPLSLPTVSPPTVKTSVPTEPGAEGKDACVEHEASVRSAADQEEVQEQLAQLVSRLGSALARVGSELRDVVNVHMYLSRMDLFVPANAEYCKHFGPHPPARSCVSVSAHVDNWQCAALS